MKQHTITIIKINSPKAIKVWSPCSTMSSTRETYSGRIRFHSHSCRRWQEHSSGFTLMRTNLQNRYGITRVLSQSSNFNEVHLTVKKGGPSQAPRHVRDQLIRHLERGVGIFFFFIPMWMGGCWKLGGGLFEFFFFVGKMGLEMKFLGGLYKTIEVNDFLKVCFDY